MTNSEYFEKNKISFAEAFEIFNKQKSKNDGIKSFDEFLASERAEPKFKAEDLVVLQLNEETGRYGWKHNVVFGVVGVGRIENCYTLKNLTPNGSDEPYIGMTMNFPIDYIDRNCILY